MADAKRWSVTYTKHVKQKRKVCQDGFLELHVSTNKLLLYDDCEKLLECRVLKRDETVSCGETLAFNAFLVNVNGADGHHEPPPPPASSSLGRGNRSVTEKRKSQKLNSSPSHQIIRDFKKREILKYEAMQSKSPDATKSSITVEWEALYTMQLTQKTKKYHDGFLQLSVRGSTGRQVMLFDASRNSIDSRFLRKDEKIESGGTITFDGHLVKVGEPRGDHKSSGDNCDVTTQKGTIHGQDNYTYRRNTLRKESIKTEVQKDGASHRSQDTTEASATEWQVLYTTQLTQKSKKYHDGFLQLAICGSRGRQAMLYDANKTILHSRFLKKEEVIRTGVSFKFDAYLVDIGEPEGKNKIDLTALTNDCNVVKDAEKVHVQQSSLTSSNYTLKGKSLTAAGLRIDAKSNFSFSNQDTKESIRTDHTNKPLRDVRQILSLLRKPKPKSTPAVGDTDNKMSPTKEPLVSNAADLVVSRDDQLPKLLAPHDQTCKIVDSGESTETKELDRPPDTISSKEISNGSGSQLQKVTDNGNSKQLCSGIEADNSCQNGANSSNMPSATASCGKVDDAKNPYEASKEMDEYPSFDLGF